MGGPSLNWWSGIATRNRNAESQRGIATRNRNAENALDAAVIPAVRAMQRDASVMGQWVRGTRGGASGTRYIRRITVEASCLACHGARDARPQFVKERYPADRAFGFSVGDLRGVYSVFIPDSLGDT